MHKEHDWPTVRGSILTLLLAMLLLVPLSAKAAGLGETAPPFSLKDQRSRTVSSSDYRGKILLVTFWSPWCVPCRDELPSLETLYGKYRSKGVEIVAIAVDGNREAVAGFVRKNSITYPVLFDEDRAAFEAYRCSHLPTMFIVGRDGTVKQITKGYGNGYVQLYEQEIIELLHQQ